LIGPVRPDAPPVDRVKREFSGINDTGVLRVWENPPPKLHGTYGQFGLMFFGEPTSIASTKLFYKHEFTADMVDLAVQNRALIRRDRESHDSGMIDLRNCDVPPIGKAEKN
jgi:hypothetical protein